MNEKIKVLISDYDGTLYRNGVVSKQDINAIQKWQASGNAFWIATGRGPEFMDDMNRGDGLNAECAVCHSGAAIVRNGQIEYIYQIPDQVAVSLFSLLDTEFPLLDYSLSVNRPGMHYERIAGGSFSKHRGFQVPNKDTRKEFLTSGASLVRIFACGPDNAYIAQVQQRIQETLGEYIRAMKTDDSCIDIVAKDCDKWNALLRLMDTNAIKPEHCAAIGDQQTDLAMIKGCAKGFYMHTADLTLQRYADAVVNSVADALAILGKDR